MADETTIKWLYPPNFSGTYKAGAKGHLRHRIQCTNYSDGTGEDESIKVKRTDLKTITGEVPSKIVIEQIEYELSGMGVEISYNNINNEIVAILDDTSGCLDFTGEGGFVPADDDDDEGGDIIFTTFGQSLGDTYNIILTVRPKQ